MAQGKKYNDDLKERAFALLSTNNNVAFVAQELGLPYSTVNTWKIGFEKSENCEDNLANVRSKRKEEFVNKAWKIMDTAQSLLERRLTRAAESEEEIDRVVKSVQDMDKLLLSDVQKKALLNQLNAIKIEDIGKIATVMGVSYDKQALANKEATSIIEGEVTIKKFEDY